VNLTDQQWGLLRVLVSNHESSGGAEFYFASSHSGSGISYASGAFVNGTYDYTDFYQLRSERLITLIPASRNVYRGKPTQLGITTVRRNFAVVDEHAKQTTDSDSAFWHHRRDEFHSLPPAEYTLVWSNRRPVDLNGRLLPSQWSWLRFPDESLRARLSAIALKCAKALGHDSEDGWFDELRKADFVKFKLTGRRQENQPDGSIVEQKLGLLSDIVKHSITLCHVLEAAGSQHNAKSSRQLAIGLLAHKSEPPSGLVKDFNPTKAKEVPFQRIAKRPIHTSPPSPREIEKYAEEVFEAGLEDRIDGYARDQDRALAEVRSRNNVGAFLPALIKCKQEHLRAEILTKADAWVKAGTIYGVPLGEWAHKALEKDAVLMAAGTNSALREELRLYPARTRTTRRNTGGEQAIHRAMKSALGEAKLKLKTQRIIAEHSLGDVPPPVLQKETNSAKNYKTALARNIDRFRKECGWSFDQLSRKTGLDKKLILGHVNEGKGTRPNTVKIYADAFTKGLNRTVTVVEIESATGKNN
jgi:hypothetical protein